MHCAAAAKKAAQSGANNALLCAAMMPCKERIPVSESSGLPGAAQHMQHLVSHHVLDGGAAHLQIAPGIKIRRMLV